MEARATNAKRWYVRLMVDMIGWRQKCALGQACVKQKNKAKKTKKNRLKHTRAHTHAHAPDPHQRQQTHVSFAFLPFAFLRNAKGVEHCLSLPAGEQ
jgi:hypothetical protein